MIDGLIQAGFANPNLENEHDPQPANNAPIGIFDSGVGGLTVLAKIQEILPGESLIYVGDTANAPYGGKSHDELLGHGRDIIRFLRRQNVKAIVLACGTTSSTVYQQLVDENPGVPLVDVVRPGVEVCAKLADENPGLRIGLIATAATIRSGLFAKLLKAHGVSVVMQACPMFAPMVEAGVTFGPVARWVAETYVGSWRSNVDALVLGCTHYPLLEETLGDVLGAGTQFINLAESTAQALKTRLAMAGCLNDGSTPPGYQFCVSGDPVVFSNTARLLLGREIAASRIEFV